MVPVAPVAAPDWFHAWVSDLDATAGRWPIGDGKWPMRLPSFTVTALPDPQKYARCLIFVADGTANKRLAVSDGTAWRFPDGNPVS
ncbi:MAG: hypothetical protein F8N37_12060 [Telmatospirillum sp.]|nr:hypothetical protein [Telmatospirillum sp.]